METHALTYEGLRDGAIEASKSGRSFDEYCECLVKCIISGQSKDFIKGLLMGQGLHIFFLDTWKEKTYDST